MRDRIRLIFLLEDKNVVFIVKGWYDIETYPETYELYLPHFDSRQFKFIMKSGRYGIFRRINASNHE
jgi:hypothetical protein